MRKIWDFSVFDCAIISIDTERFTRHVDRFDS